MSFDLDLWPTNLKINRNHLLIVDYLPTKFESSRTKNCWVISCTRYKISTWRPLTLTFDSLTWIYIGTDYSSRTIYLPSLKLMKQSVPELSVAQGIGNQHDLWSTDLKINRDHLLILDYLPIKFEAYNKVLLSYQLYKILEISMTFDLDLWPTDLNINRKHLLIEDYLPTKFFLGKMFSSYQLHKVEGDRHTDRPTDRPTDGHVQRNLPSLFKGGHKNAQKKPYMRHARMIRFVLKPKPSCMGHISMTRTIGPLNL